MALHQPRRGASTSVRNASILALAALLSAGAARAAVTFFPEQGKNDIPTEYFRFDVKEWFSSGSSRYQKEFPFPFQVNGPPADISMGSTLNFNGLKSDITVFSEEVRPVGWFSVAVDFGTAGTNGGTGFDHDWINAPNVILTSPSGFTYVTPNHEDFSLSQESLSGYVRFVSPTAYLRVISLREGAGTGDSYLHLFDVGLGYGVYDELVHITNGVQVAAPDAYINSVIGLPPPGTAFEGLNSSYRFHWQGVRLALREKLLLGPHLSSEGKFGVIPAASYAGTGIWNLRGDFQQNPSFTQRTTGHAYDFSLDLAYEVVQYVTLKAGYMLEYFTASGGTDTTRTVAAGDVNDTLDNVKLLRSGVFVGAAFQF
ncbi:MAG: hypothetical protein ACHQ49_08940 [Elusimicrobiota bacterium]